MTKTDFVRLAKALVAFRRAEPTALTTEQYEALVDQLALAAEDRAVRREYFSYEKFLAACGVES